MIGKKIRLNRILRNNSKQTCIVPIDHGMTFGLINGLVKIEKLVMDLIDSGINSFVLHKGILKKLISYGILDCSYIMHLSASTVYSNDLNKKVLVGQVSEAVQLGADAVSIHINIGCDSELDMLSDFGRVSRECSKWGMPLLGMIYSKKNNRDINEIIHCIRIAEELGADMVKVDFPSDYKELKKISVNSGLPVFIAGGEKHKDVKELFDLIYHVKLYGIRGMAIGRNIFQYKDPGLLASMICNIMCNDWHVEKCLNILDESMQHTKKEKIDDK